METILHVLRDCPAMAEFLLRIVSSHRRREYFLNSLLEWLFENLLDGFVWNGIPWATTFAMACWWGWINVNVFGENKKCRDRVKFVKDISQEVAKAKKCGSSNNNSRGRVERLIRWRELSMGWFKLDTYYAFSWQSGFSHSGRSSKRREW